MLKGMEFLLKKSKAFKISLCSLSSLRVKRSNLVTSPLAGEVGASLRVRGNNKQEGWYFYRWFTSTVNVILRWYSLPEVPRRRIHKAIVSAMSRCVAVGNKVMDTRLPQPTGCGDKYDMQCGRSMIEMLGVLAIIAVLSVGGIAGYSKAMTKWKINRTISEYNYLLFGLIEHLDDLRRNKSTNGWIELADYVSGLNLVSENWKKIQFPALTSGLTLSGFQDTYNNYLFLLLVPPENFVQIEIRLGGQTTTDNGQISEAFSKEFCVDWFLNVAKPLHSSVRSVSLWKASTKIDFWGNTYCSRHSNCLENLTVNDISKLCSSCDKQNEWCQIVTRL